MEDVGQEALFLLRTGVLRHFSEARRSSRNSCFKHLSEVSLINAVVNQRRTWLLPASSVLRVTQASSCVQSFCGTFEQRLPALSPSCRLSVSVRTRNLASSDWTLFRFAKERGDANSGAQPRRYTRIEAKHIVSTTAALPVCASGPAGVSSSGASAVKRTLAPERTLGAPPPHRNAFSSSANVSFIIERCSDAISFVGFTAAGHWGAGHLFMV